jgi:DNA primase
MAPHHRPRPPTSPMLTSGDECQMSVVDEIKERIDAVELISNYVQLKRAGRNYKGLCPFHAENTPSFVVFPETGTWHCFGACSEGGDIFTFVMKREGWDFRTSLEELARRAGVELKPRTEQEEAEDQERSRLREILAAAAVYFHNLLLKAPQAQHARAYITQRGLKERTVETFQLGYALDEWHALEGFLTGKGYTREELITAGLMVERDDGRAYDRFRGRLMIPIRDRRGRVIGFGARTLDADGVPKYLNSPQTPVFDKGDTLYGLDRAIKGIRAAERVVVVEGYMDVMQAHQAGFTDVVAQLGTALTEENLRRLTRYTRRIILALDPDTAGQAATMRGLDVARQALEPEWQPVFDARGLIRLEARLSADIRVLALPPGQDPDELIRHDATRWAVLVDQAVPLVEHYMRALLKGQDLDDPKVKTQVTQDLVPVIRQVSSPVERAHYAQRLARTLRVDERTLLDMVASAPRERRRRQRPAEPAPALQRSTRADLESYCLQGLLHTRSLLDTVDALLAEIGLDPISAGDFHSAENREIFRVWRELIEAGMTPSFEQLAQGVPVQLQPRLSALSDTSLLTLNNRKWLMEAQVDPAQDAFDLQPDEVEQDLLNGLLKLRERNLRRRNVEIRFLLEDTDQADARVYQSEISKTIMALARLQRMLSSKPIGEDPSLSGAGNLETAF